MLQAQNAPLDVFGFIFFQVFATPLQYTMTGNVAGVVFRSHAVKFRAAEIEGTKVADYLVTPPYNWSSQFESVAKNLVWLI